MSNESAFHDCRKKQAINIAFVLYTWDCLKIIIFFVCALSLSVTDNIIG